MKADDPMREVSITIENRSYEVPKAEITTKVDNSVYHKVTGENRILLTRCPGPRECQRCSKNAPLFDGNSNPVPQTKIRISSSKKMVRKAQISDKIIEFSEKIATKTPKIAKLATKNTETPLTTEILTDVPVCKKIVTNPPKDQHVQKFVQLSQLPKIATFSKFSAIIPPKNQLLPNPSSQDVVLTETRYTDTTTTPKFGRVLHNKKLSGWVMLPEEEPKLPVKSGEKVALWTEAQKNTWLELNTLSSDDDDSSLSSYESTKIVTTKPVTNGMEFDSEELEAEIDADIERLMNL